jgi:hypothetical protein
MENLEEEEEEKETEKRTTLRNRISLALCAREMCKPVAFTR